MTTKELRQWFLIRYDYNPTTGLFTSRLSNREMVSRNGKGYLRIGGPGDRVYFAHRVAYLIMEGEWPVQIDHKNRVRDDNRWDNLRDSDQMLNAQNHSLRKTNTTGHQGVEYVEGKGFRATLQRNQKRRRSKWLKDIQEAIDSRNEMYRLFASGEW